MTDKGARAKQRDAEDKSLDKLLLLQTEPVSQGQPCASECRIAGSNRADDNADHGESDTDTAHGILTYVIDGGRLSAGEYSGKTGGKTACDFVQRAAGGSPDQGDDAFCDHGAVEYEMSLTLRF